ncbi:MAG: DUF5674 family protein [Gemmatimonadaceae bacterium]
MTDFTIEIIRVPVSRSDIARRAEEGFGDMVKDVVDITREVMAIGAELNSDEEAALVADGSRQTDLWGINLHPADSSDAWLEFDSLINVRPSQGNRTRGVDDVGVQRRIRQVLSSLVRDA